MIYRIIILLVILTAAITDIVISMRNFRRELESQMEDIKRRQLEAAGVDGYHRIRCNLDESQINAIIENAEAIVESSNFKRLKLNFKPNKHIKRHSIR